MLNCVQTCSQVTVVIRSIYKICFHTEKNRNHTTVKRYLVKQKELMMNFLQFKILFSFDCLAYQIKEKKVKLHQILFNLKCLIQLQAYFLDTLSIFLQFFVVTQSHRWMLKYKKGNRKKKPFQRIVEYYELNWMEIWWRGQRWSLSDRLEQMAGVCSRTLSFPLLGCLIKRQDVCLLVQASEQLLGTGQQMTNVWLLLWYIQMLCHLIAFLK